MDKLIPIQFKTQKVLLTEQLADVYGSDVNNIKNNFSNHKDNFEEGKHYYFLQGTELKEFKNQVNDIDLVNKHTASLYLWTERGANRHCKILDTDKAWEQFDNLEETYFKVKENVQQLNTSELSPELQMFNKMFQAVANVELSNKQLKEEITNTNEKIDGIKDIVALNSTDWKKDTSSLISKMALKLGGFEHISDLRKESYNLLNKRTGVKLETRLTNKHRRMADKGVCKSKSDKLNYIDVIAEDKKELEVYLAIVKEMAIKYGVA